MKSVRVRSVAIGLCMAAIWATGAIAGNAPLPEAPGRDQVLLSCTQCHGVDTFAQPRTPDEWSQVVSMMVGYGASMTDEEYVAVLNYLSENMNPSSTPSQSEKDGGEKTTSD